MQNNLKKYNFVFMYMLLKDKFFHRVLKNCELDI